MLYKSTTVRHFRIQLFYVMFFHPPSLPFTLCAPSMLVKISFYFTYWKLACYDYLFYCFTWEMFINKSKFTFLDNFIWFLVPMQLIYKITFIITLANWHQNFPRFIWHWFWQDLRRTSWEVNGKEGPRKINRWRCERKGTRTGASRQRISPRGVMTHTPLWG